MSMRPSPGPESRPRRSSSQPRSTSSKRDWWLRRLVAHARETAELRIVLRAFQPDEIEERRDEIDIVVAGAEVAWVTPAQIATWRRMGLNVVGVHARGDVPAAAML